MDAKASSHAEEAIMAIGRGDVPLARTSVALAFEEDPTIGYLADAIYMACAEYEDDGEVSTATWNALADAVDSHDLLATVEASRTH